MRNQLDIFKDDPVRMAKANREAADYALHDRQFTESERQERAAYYTREAERWEFSAPLAASRSTAQRSREHEQRQLAEPNTAPNPLKVAARAVVPAVRATLLRANELLPHTTSPGWIFWIHGSLRQLLQP